MSGEQLEKQAEALRWLGFEIVLAEDLHGPYMVWRYETKPAVFVGCRYSGGQQAMLEEAVRTAVSKQAPGSYAAPSNRRVEGGGKHDFEDCVAILLCDRDGDIFDSAYGANYTHAWINAAIELWRAGRDTERSEEP